VTYKEQTRPLVREGAPQTQDNKFQTQTLEKEAISGQTSTKWAREVTLDLQRIDPTSRQRGRPTERRQQIPDPNTWKGSNIWSNVHKVDSIPRLTGWHTVSRKVILTLTDRRDTQGQTRPLVREGAPQKHDNKFQTQTLEKEAISGQTSINWAWHQDILTDWLSAVKWLWLCFVL
jgi:hypothetical protein